MASAISIDTLSENNKNGNAAKNAKNTLVGIRPMVRMNEFLMSFPNDNLYVTPSVII